MSETTRAIWLTQEAYDKLRRELEQLSGPGRADVTARIAAARDEGDLKENGGYHAAREEQGKQEARIRQLTDMLRRAEVGEAPANADEVVPGTQVTIAFDGDESDTDTFVLGSRELLAKLGLGEVGEPATTPTREQILSEVASGALSPAEAQTLLARL